jgi:antitoxin component of MazEF toxin-antitoxin module
MEHTKIRRIGNGRGILLSKPLCNMMGMDYEDSFRVEMESGKLILVPIRR